jgi:hypothetical protein
MWWIAAWPAVSELAGPDDLSRWTSQASAKSKGSQIAERAHRVNAL